MLAAFSYHRKFPFGVAFCAIGVLRPPKKFPWGFAFCAIGVFCLLKFFCGLRFVLPGFAVLTKNSLDFFSVAVLPKCWIC